MGYKGRLVYTITKEDNGKTMICVKHKKCEHCGVSPPDDIIQLGSFIGRIMKIDIGKQIHVIGGVPYIESQEQYEKRVST